MRAQFEGSSFFAWNNTFEGELFGNCLGDCHCSCFCSGVVSGLCGRRMLSEKCVDVLL